MRTHPVVQRCGRKAAKETGESEVLPVGDLCTVMVGDEALDDVGGGGHVAAKVGENVGGAGVGVIWLLTSDDGGVPVARLRACASWLVALLIVAAAAAAAAAQA